MHLNLWVMNVRMASRYHAKYVFLATASLCCRLSTWDWFYNTSYTKTVKCPLQLAVSDSPATIHTVLIQKDIGSIKKLIRIDVSPNEFSVYYAH